MTEIGAVKVRGGREIGVFVTLVNPGSPIWPKVTALTGITDEMVGSAPPMEAVLPSLLEFVAGAVLVAHNAAFDVGFMRAACDRHGYEWPATLVLDTAVLARRLLCSGEVTSFRLGVLADYFCTVSRPRHRALDDARATAEVLCALVGRLAERQVFTLGGAVDYTMAVPRAQRRRRVNLVDGLPDVPGVFIFRDGAGRALYIGAGESISAGVRACFEPSETETGGRILKTIHFAQRVEAVECAHGLEAAVRGLRLIAANRPPFNPPTTFGTAGRWLRLSEDGGRLSVLEAIRDGCVHLGPFDSRRAIRLAVQALCAVAEPYGHVHGRVDQRECLRRAANPFVRLVTGDPTAVVNTLATRMDGTAGRRSGEDAPRVREGLSTLMATMIRMLRLTSVTCLPMLAAGRRAPSGGWELAVVRYGRLVAAGSVAPRVDPRGTLAALLSDAEAVRLGPGPPIPCASAAESERVLDWLEQPDVRLLECRQGWALPATTAARLARLLMGREFATVTASSADRRRRPAGRGRGRLPKC